MVKPPTAVDAYASTGRGAQATPTAAASVNAFTAELLTWLAERHAETPPEVAARERLAVLRVLRECPEGLPDTADDAVWGALLTRARSAGSSPPRWLRRAVVHLRAFQARDAGAGPSVASASLARDELESELEGLPASLQGEVREALERREGSDEYELAASALAAARAWRED